MLLDDCLSAVDSHTAQHIFEECIMGPLMRGRTCILVTHNLALTLAEAKHAVVLGNGKILGQGTPDDLRRAGLVQVETDDATASKPNPRPGSKVGSEMDGGNRGQANGHARRKSDGEASAKKKAALQDDVEDANKRIEGRAEGAITLSVIKLYFSAMGHWWYPAGIVLGYVLSQLSNIATNVWIRSWANAYNNAETAGTMALGSANGTGHAYVSMSMGRSWSPTADLLHWAAPGTQSSTQSSFSATAFTKPSVPFYLGIYALLGLIYVLLCIAQYFFLFGGSLKASRAIHARLLESILRAKFKFFDITPLGQLMNRFSKDLQSIDQEIAAIAAGVLQTGIGCITTVILIAFITPAFLIAAAFLAALYVAIALFYVSSSRDLKRLESANRSPLYQQFGETINGITTIRAYGDEARFIADNAQRINTHNRPFIYLWATNRWLSLRVLWAGALVAFFAAMFIVISAGKLDAGAAGISLSYALTFNDSVLWLVRLYAENEQNMNHVERVKQYLDVEQEAPAIIAEKRPPDNWPSKGAVRFENYTTRYRADLDPVLKNLNVNIKGMEKVGIVGRTGAGKSSLALAMFRGLEADEGRILIDDVDVGTIGLQDLRENITIVPQDPTLFTGTIRSNLDPFNMFSDEDILTALRRVHLIGSDSVANTRAATPEELPRPEEAHSQHAMDQAIEDQPITQDLALGAPSIVAPPAPTEPLSSPKVENNVLAPSGANSRNKVRTKTGRTNINIFHNLSSPIAESGSNLSQGQRQLLCLARALLKNPRVLLMDEATASIDYATDAKIQDTLRELTGNTIITIAHRLKTIVDYDKVMVLDKGEVVEFGEPWVLIKKEAGMFRGLCESSGDLQSLLDGAEKARRARMLVDVDDT